MSRPDCISKPLPSLRLLTARTIASTCSWVDVVPQGAPDTLSSAKTEQSRTTPSRCVYAVVNVSSLSQVSYE